MSSRARGDRRAAALGFGGLALACRRPRCRSSRRGPFGRRVVVAMTAAWYRHPAPRGVPRRRPRRRSARAGGGDSPAVRDRLLEELVVVGALVLGCACARRRSSCASTCRASRPPGSPSCSSTPVGGDQRRRSSRWPPKPGHAESSRSSWVRRGTSSGSSATLSPAAPTGSRWQAVTARRRSSPRSPRARPAYACVPAGTRNHFALDLGVDRDDVVGALDAFVDGGERRVDLAEVNGRRVRQQRLARPLRRCRPARGLSRGEAPDDARRRPRCARPRRSRARSALDGAQRARARFGSRDPGLEQPLPAGPRRRLGHAPDDRRWPAGGHGRRSADRPQRTPAAAPWRDGRRRPSRSMPTTPSPPASTARP